MALIPWGPLLVAGIGLVGLFVIAWGAYLLGKIQAGKDQADEAKTLAENLLATDSRIRVQRVSSGWLHSSSTRPAPEVSGPATPRSQST